MNSRLEEWIPRVEATMIMVDGFSGIGVVDYGQGDIIEIGARDVVAAENIRRVLHPTYSHLPISVVVTGTTKPL